MKAIAICKPLPVSDPHAFVELKLPDPTPSERDLLVRVKAVSVNPVDAKLRMRRALADNQPRVLGWDACGVVEAVGNNCTLFKPGDEVMYAGSIDRPGCYSELHCVDERITGKKPGTLSYAQAAALPLTSLTAWELLFERMGVQQGKKEKDKALLVSAAAGGVGSILVQLASALTELTVIGTAAREESAAWARQMGADHIINYKNNLKEELTALGIAQVEYIASLSGTDALFASYAQVIAPFGRIGLIDTPAPLDLTLIKPRAASLHWEYMFARPLYQSAHMQDQHNILTRVAEMIDEGKLRSTMKENLGSINAENIRQAHARIESGQTIGKLVLEGF